MAQEGCGKCLSSSNQEKLTKVKFTYNGNMYTELGG